MKKYAALLMTVGVLFSAATSFSDSPALQKKLATLAATKGSFRFAVMGDNRSGDRVYKKIMSQMMLRSPLLVVNTGDEIPNPGDRAEWKNFWEISKLITVPYFLVVGNHDVDSKESAKVWQEEVDLPGNELYYSFTVGKNLFVILNSCDPDEDRKIEGEQWRWLEGVLSKVGYEHKFVFLHHPLFLRRGADHYGGSMDRYPDQRDRLHQLFVAKKVDAVFMGHEHTFNRMTKDGVAYVIVGGAGAPLYGKESYNNFALIDVDGKFVDAKIIDREGAMRDEFVISR